MRPLSTLETIVDVDGLPINGRVKIFVLGEGTAAQIYDYEKNVIANPQPLVNGVTAKQIFLPDHDVSVEVQVLVDHAFPSSDDSWECVRSIVDTYRTVDITNDSKGVYIVNGKNQLRATTPEQVQKSAGVKYVQLYGSSGTGPLTYGWVQGYSVNDNDGDVIASSGDMSGRWVAVFESELVDCRYFGIIPMASAEMLTAADSTRIATFLNRCAAIGKRPYFPSTMTAAYYNIANNTVSAPVVDGGTFFANLEGNVASVIDSDVKIYSGVGFGKITVTADVVRTSQNARRSTQVVLVPRVRAILDTSYITNYKWNGVEVSVDVDQDGGIFDRCKFSGKGKFGAGTFSNCNVYQSMFDEDFDFGLNDFANCYTTISEWSDFDKYLSFCVSNGEVEVDMHGNTIVRFPNVSVNVLKLSNAVINHELPDNVIPSNIKFRDCTFKKIAISNYFDCNGCVFEKNARCVTDDRTNTSGTVSANFIGCVFTGGHIVMDFGTSARASMGILSFVVKDCVFNNRSPISAVWSGGETTAESENGVKELDVSNLYVTGCVGVTWSTDMFVAKKSLDPSLVIPQTSGTQLLSDVGFPFVKCPSIWEMETGLFCNVGSQYVREVSTRTYSGRYEFLSSAVAKANGTTLEEIPSIVFAYAKIRRIA